MSTEEVKNRNCFKLMRDALAEVNSTDLLVICSIGAPPGGRDQSERGYEIKVGRVPSTEEVKAG